MPRVVVDRVEGERLLVEVDGQPAEIGTDQAPVAAVEGTVWEVSTWPPPTWTRLPADPTAAEALLERLRAATPQKGDIEL
jgi:hypothetical protein